MKPLSSQNNVALQLKKTNQILEIIKRKIKNQTKDIIVKLCKALVKPHFEHCTQLRNPYIKADIKQLEGIQKRALKMIKRF